MRFVRVERSNDGWILDPEPYLGALPALSLQLPDGARAFAMDPEHYNFTGSRCVKDLKIESISIREAGNALLDTEITFGANKWKHDANLSVVYRGVTRFNLDVAPMGANARVWPKSRRLGDLQLDELLPIPGGCLHEVKFTGGTVIVECADVLAEWQELSVGAG